MADRILSSGATVAQSLGIRPPMRQTITTGLADLEVEKQAALDRIAGLGAASAPRLRPPPDSALRAGPDIYYSPSTDRYAAGGMEFGATEYDVALRAMENLQAPTRSPGGDFQRIPVSTLEAYRKSISEGRGLVGNLAVGAQNVGEGIVGGIGRGLQMLGAEGVGQAFVDVGEAIGMSPAEQARSAAIAQEQGLGGQIVTAAVQSAPTLGVAIGAGLAGAAVGGPVGALAGVALSILPMELQASWEAAEQGGLDTSDPEIQTEILASTLFKTGVQTFGTAYLARGLSPAFRTMLGDVSKRTMGARITRGIGAGALEGSAEAIAQATDRVAFDPELRASMTEGDWAAIAPAFVNKYGTEALVAFGAGFLLGAPLGAIASPEATTQTSPSPRRNVDSGQQIDALSGATLEPQALPTPAPVAGLLPPPPAALPAPPAGLLPAPPAALPAPDRSAAAAPDIIVPPAPAGSVAPPVVPAPAAPVAPAPITAPDLGLEGPVAEGFNIASLQQGPPAPPPRVTPQVFSAGPAESTVQSPFVEPMNALRQQQVARMERLAAEGVAQKRAKEARLEAEQRGAAAWDALVEEQGGVDFIALPARAQEAWINAVAANVGPRGQTLQQYFDALVRAAGRAGRRQQAEATPEPTPPSVPEAPPALPEGVVGTAKDKPFKARPSELSIRNASKRSGVPVSRLEPVEVPEGWGLRVLPEPPTPPTPPTGGKTTRTPPQEGAAKRRARKAKDAAKITKGTRGAVQEQGPEAGAVRQGPETGEGVRGEDTQGQEAAGARVEEVQEEVAADYQPLAQPRSEAFGTFTRLRVMRRGDQYVEQRRVDEIDGGRVTKPGQWKYSSTLLDKAGMDTRYQKRKDEGFEAGTATEIAALPEGSPPARPRRGAGAEVQIVEGRGGRRELEPVAPAEPEAIAEPEAPQTPQQRVAAEDLAEVDALIEAVETTSNEAEAAQQLAALVEWSEAGSKAAKARAQEFLTDMEADPATARQVATARSKAKLGTDISKARSDVEKARKSVADGKKGAEKKLADAEAKLEKLQRDAAKVGGASKSAADQIVSVIEKVNAGGVVSLGDRSKLVRWWSEAKADNPQYNDRPLADYITGGPDFFNYGPRVNGHRQVIPKGAGRTSRTTFNFVGGAFNNLDGSSISRALPYGKAKLVISSFRSKLKQTPSVKVFTSVAQLKRKDPALYARAAAARSQGDFDNVTAAGYSFGDGEVLIFTDNVANEAHLRFVLAHETMGHYGLRGFIPAAEFDKTMESIYDNFPHIQAPVDAAMAATDGLGKAEAVEEYLSDYAALLETNLLLRVWNAVKGALNALGLKFADDYPRYLINHARQYARRPGGGHFADMDTIAQRANGVETGAIAPGRYKRSDELFGNVESMMSTARLLVGDRPILKAAEKRVITDLPNTWETAKNEFLSLFPFQARKNPGLKELNEIITDGEQRTQHIRNLLDEEAAPALNKAIKVPGVDFEFGGVTEAETALMNNALAVARIRAAQGLLADPKANQSKTPIFTYDKTTGTFKETVIDPATGETEADRLASLYAITRDEFDSEFTATIKRETGEQEVRKYVRDPKVTNTDRAWDGYQRLRRAFVEAQKILLLAKLSANTATVDGALEEIASLMPNNRLTSEQRRLIRKASQLYSDLYNKGIGVDTRTGQMQADPEAIKQAEEFLQAFNTAIIADKPADQDTDLSNKNSAASRNKNLRDIIAKVASKQEADDIVASIENFKGAIRVEVTGQPGKFVSGLRKDQYLIQQKIANLNTAQFTANNGEQSFRYLVASQFTPIIQKGNYQVRIVPVSADGEPVALGDAYGGSVGYTQFATQSEADAFAEAFMAKQVDENGDPLMFEADTKGSAGETVKASIRLEARVDEVQSDVLAPTRMGLQEFMMQIAHYSVPLTPGKRQEIMIDATRQDDRARKRLLTEFTPGDPKLGVEAIAKHIEGLASTAAKIEMRPRIERLMSRRNRRSQELWDGDPKRVEATKARYERLMADPGASREQVDAAQRDYEEAKMLFDETGGMPNKYKNQAGKLLAFINDNETLTESNFDASAFISTWRTLTAVAQLGLNFVTAALNPVSVYTNVAPYLATRNSETAFGGGFGMGRTMTELNRAFTQVGLPGTLPTKESAKFNEASFWEGVAVNGALQKKYKVTDFEARMLAQEIRRGSMQPTLTNSLVNMSRGLASTAVGRKVADGMMFMFNVSEQASRRAAGLAAFRMEFARRVATIDPDLKGAEYEAAVEQSYRESTKFVREMLDLTIGNYATSKRPNFFRGGWPGILYMYKVFPTTSIQLFRNMDAKGKMWMLAGLWALGGIAAWPFAEEVEDLLDTLDQKFGLGVGTGSIRAFAVQEFDTIMPGLGQLILTGGFGQFLPLDIASRVSLSAVPGTEFFLAGTDRARMYEEIAGPMPSALFGAGAAILDAVRAPFSTTITAEDVAREAPVTAIRLLADTYAYLNSGAIVDRRGYVVSPDVKWYDIAARMAGGYPISAAEEYGAIRVINRTVNHRREVSAQYRSDWVQASIRGDFARRREIEEAVREWNRTHRGTPLEITNFRQGAQRALREARRPATERTLRTTPTAGRSVSEDIIDALTR